MIVFKNVLFNDALGIEMPFYNDAKGKINYRMMPKGKSNILMS